jgi:hypothetical protein
MLLIFGQVRFIEHLFHARFMNKASEMALRSLLNLCRASKRFSRLLSVLLYGSLSIPASKLQHYEATDPAAGSHFIPGERPCLFLSSHGGKKIGLGDILDVISRMARVESIR